MSSEPSKTSFFSEDSTRLKPRAFKIGDLAKHLGTTTRTLRYYEEIGLLSPLRNTSGQRLYGDGAVKRLEFIHELKAGGFSLLEIRNFFESWRENKTGAEAAEKTVSIIQQKLLEIAEAQKNLAKLNDELRSIVGFLLVCRSCDQQPSAENCVSCDRHQDESRNLFLMNLLKRAN